MTIRLEDLPAAMFNLLREGSPKGTSKDVEPEPD